MLPRRECGSGEEVEHEREKIEKKCGSGEEVGKEGMGFIWSLACWSHLSYEK